MIEEKFPGIYYVTGNTLFPTQIVVTCRLGKEAHSSLRILSKDVQIEDVRRFLRETENLVMPGERNNVDAVLQVSVPANRAVYEKVKEEWRMCEALRELMKDEFEEELEKKLEQGLAEGREKAMAEGRVEGRAEGRAEGTISAISNLMKSMKLTAEQAMEALDIPKNERDLYSAKLMK
jgi:predicted transposase/invertase (TIGR01784 family)